MDEDREKLVETRTDPSGWLEVNPQDTGLKNGYCSGTILMHKTCFIELCQPCISCAELDSIFTNSGPL